MELARDLLGAIAFEMFCGRGGQGQSPPLFTVTGDLRPFLNRVYHRFEAAGAYRSALGRPIDVEYLPEEWRHLKAMNAYGLQHLVFSEAEERLQFVDITTQAFFAAYWACQWGHEQDRELLWSWVPNPIASSNESYHELWTFIAEMPDEGIDRGHWETLLSPLYDGSLVDDRQRPIRATEIIYRHWDRMKDTEAGEKFRTEFSRILTGECGDNPQQVARSLLLDENAESHFLPLCKQLRGEMDTGQFEMGAPADEEPRWDTEIKGGRQDNPVHQVQLSPYRLHRYCVTNEAYELFDPRHRSRREFEEKVEDVAHHPVVNVSWYDAWTFATWLGRIMVDEQIFRVQLPTEAQWEYACRAGRSTPFTWDKGSSGDKAEPDYCNFDGNFPWHPKGTPEAEKGPYRQRTVRVDGLDEAGGTPLPANQWGFHQMHGNVWEWCSDWYVQDYYSTAQGLDPPGPLTGHERVLRGGGWIGSGRGCRSAFRFANGPGIRGRSVGFRLAAVPASSKE